MKTKVTMKVKHFVMILFSVFVILPLVGMFLFPQVELVMAKHAFENGKAGAKEKVLTALESRILPSQKYELISMYVLGYHGYEDYDVYVGPTMSSLTFAEESMIFSWDTKLEYIKEYVKSGPVNDGLHAAAEKLASYAVSQDDLDWAVRIYEHAIERAENSNMEYVYFDISLSYAQFLLREQALDKAEVHLLELLAKTPEFQSYYRGEAVEYYFQTILRNGNQERAIVDINQLLDDLATDWRDPYENKAFEQSDIYRKLTSLAQRLHNTDKWSESDVATVTGYVKRDDGTPLAGAALYLRDESEVNRSISYQDRHSQVTTDENGYYEIKGVTPGKYQMFAGFTLDHIDGYTWPVSMEDWIQVDGTKDISYDVILAPLMDVYSPVNETVVTEDELTLSWEEVPEAAYYMVGFNIEGKGMTTGISFGRQFTETEGTILLEELYHTSPGVLIDKDEMDRDFFDPTYYLGFSNPEGKYSWKVAAYDADDELITQSDGYRLNASTVGDVPVLYLKTRELIAADKLLINGKLEEALAAYKKNAEENPEDDHSLRMITRLIGIEGDGTGSTFDKLQLPYLEQLALVTEYDLYYEQVLAIHKDLENEAAYEKWEALYEAESRGD